MGECGEWTGDVRQKAVSDRLRVAVYMPYALELYLPCPDHVYDILEHDHGDDMCLTISTE